MDLLLWYPAFIVPAGIGWLGVRSGGHRRFDLKFADKAMLVVPWVIFYIVTVVFPNGKELSNLFEIVVLAAAVPTAMLVRVVCGRTVDQVQLSYRLLGLVCIVGVVAWIWVPLLPVG